VHCASLGEYEMVVPILSSSELQEKYEVVVSFFSSSGYVHAKTDGIANAVFYLPFDRKAVMRKLVAQVNPEIFILVKYDFWLNLMSALNQHGCKTILVNGLFREKAFMASSIAGPWRNQLKRFTRLFVQNETSHDFLKQYTFDNVELSNDLRYDRVVQLKETNQSVPKIAQFVDDKPMLILGSSWPEEEYIALQYVLAFNKTIKLVVAPHDVSPANVKKIQHDFRKLQPKLFTDSGDLSESRILILNTIGHLSNAYQYATIALVGGAFGKGLHNVLEAAVQGLPIFTGPNIDQYPEAVALEKLGVLHSIDKDPRHFIELMANYMKDADQSAKTKEKLADWFKNNTGQAHRIKQFILSDVD
jgi:3-deoxy-D-manno-octulosonic-acid transferase